MCRLLQPARRLGVEVHHAFANRRTQAALLDGLEDRVRVVHGLHCQHRGGAAAEQFRRCQARGRAKGLGRVSRFHRPDTGAEPVHEREIVRVTSEQRLAEVDVRLDQTGQHVAAARVDRAIVTAREIGADRGDAAITDGDVPFDGVEALVHRQDEPASNQE
jgi:hypothetical protein